MSVRRSLGRYDCGNVTNARKMLESYVCGDFTTVGKVGTLRLCKRGWIVTSVRKCLDRYVSGNGVGTLHP